MTVKTFFEEYERLTNEGDAETVSRLFAPTFMSADPSGTRVVNATDLMPALVKRKQFFQMIGLRSTKLVSLEETRLADRYCLVRTEWRWRFERQGGATTEMTLPSTFILERSGESLQIVFYLTPHDITTVLRERGLVR